MDSDSNRASRRLLLGIATVVILGAALYAIFGWRFGTQRLIVRNASGVEIADVRLDIVELDGAGARSRRAERLAPGEQVLLRHGMRDLSVDVTFVLNGAAYQVHEPYIDLWTGEGWVVEIQPDGSATTGYQTAE